MSPVMPHVGLRVRLPQLAWRQLHLRAAARETNANAYADMVFRYLLHENETPRRPAAADPEQEEVYFELAIPATTKGQLANWSERQQWNLASFTGLILLEFLHRFTRDPRDLATIHYLVSRLEESELLEVTDLTYAVARCDRHTGVRLPPGYLARWLFQRLRTLVPMIRHGQGLRALSLDLIDESLQQAEKLANGAPS